MYKIKDEIPYYVLLGLIIILIYPCYMIFEHHSNIANLEENSSTVVEDIHSFKTIRETTIIE